MAKKTKFIPEDPVTDEMIDKANAEDNAEFVDTDDRFQDAKASSPSEDELVADSPAYNNKEFNVKIPFELKIGKKKFMPGIHRVNRGLAEVMAEMVDKKRRADMAVYVGKSHLVERLLDRTLVVTEVEKLDFNKMARR